jgi:hypothetical protein
MDHFRRTDNKPIMNHQAIAIAIAATEVYEYMLK